MNYTDGFYWTMIKGHIQNIFTIGSHSEFDFLYVKLNFGNIIAIRLPVPTVPVLDVY